MKAIIFLCVVMWTMCFGCSEADVAIVAPNDAGQDACVQSGDKGEQGCGGHAP